MTDVRKEKRIEGKIIPIKFDYVFVSIFNNPQNIEILENFLSCYLEIPLEEIKGNLTIMPRELELESKGSKNKQVDLILDLKGDKINIELNNNFTEGMIERNIVYACNIHGRQLRYGDNSYSNITKIIQINFNVSKKYQTDKLVEKYELKGEEGNILSKKIRIDVINVHKSLEKCYTERDEKIARWCKLMIVDTKNELEKTLGDDLMEEKAKEKLVDEVEKYSTDDEVVALYSAYTREELERNTVLEDERKEARLEGLKEGKEEGLKEGLTEGMQQGMKEGMQEVARRMLKKGISKEGIIEITGLTSEEISQI